MRNDELLRAVKARGLKRTEFGYGIVTADKFVRTLLDGVGSDLCYRYAATKDTSFDDLLRKSADVLVYGNKEMEIEDVKAGVGKLDLPKNTLMTFRHVLTSSRTDRDGDILRSQGAEVDPKMLLLWQHVHTMPIGKLVKVVQQNSKRLTVVSAIVDVNELCHDAAVMIDNGMGRFSHGFRALEFDEIKSDDEDGPVGFDVKRFEVMEESLVSVPANVDAETVDVLMSLVENGKLRSPLMKEYGKVLRQSRKIQVPGTSIEYREGEDNGASYRELTCGSLQDLKVARDEGLIGGEKDAKRSDAGSEEAGRDGTGHGPSEEADEGPEEKDQTEKAPDEEVKRVYGGDFNGSYEWVTDKLREKLKRYLASVGVAVGEHGWCWVVGTFADHVIVCVEPNEMEPLYYRIGWKMEKDEPMFDGEPAEIKVEVTTEIVERMAAARAKALDQEVRGEKPFPNEHACRLREPGDFQDGSFRRTIRKHDGKEYSVIMGRLEDETTMTEQAYRYPKKKWEAAAAKSHCKDHDGKFEAASDEDSVSGMGVKNLKPNKPVGKIEELFGELCSRWDEATDEVKRYIIAAVGKLDAGDKQRHRTEQYTAISGR